jgi:MazG family protein
MDDVPVAFPALTRAYKLQKRAANVGFDWTERQGIIDKLHEEIGELEDAFAEGAPREKLQDELGDILFVIANLARFHGVQPEEALRGTNEKFVRRFKFIETHARNTGRGLTELKLAEMEEIWQSAKQSDPAYSLAAREPAK